jgi:predicted transcriptional regulator
MKKDQVLTIRVTTDTVQKLDAMARSNGISRASMARNILANSEHFDEFIKAQAAKNVAIKAQLDEDLAREVQKELTRGVEPTVALMAAEVMKRVVQKVYDELSSNARVGKSVRRQTHRSKLRRS